MAKIIPHFPYRIPSHIRCHSCAGDMYCTALVPAITFNLYGCSVAHDRKFNSIAWYHVNIFQDMMPAPFSAPPSTTLFSTTSHDVGNSRIPPINHHLKLCRVLFLEETTVPWFYAIYLNKSWRRWDYASLSTIRRNTQCICSSRVVSSSINIVL